MRMAALLLATALWIVTPTTVFAQHGGHGGGHGGGHAAAHGGHATVHAGHTGTIGHGGYVHGGYGGYRHDGNGYGYGRGYWGGRFFGGDWPWYGYGYGAYPNDYYYSSWNGLPPAYYNDVTPYVVDNGSPPAPAMAPIYLQIIVPDPLAQVWIDGQLTTATGTVRNYTAAAEPVGYTYSYDIRVLWIDNGAQRVVERHVNVVPGVLSRVDMTTSVTTGAP